jgi:membrane-bound ClpP family serine protease
MTSMKGMDWPRGLTLIIHTPGGIGAAAQTVMSYLHSKFDYIEVIVPTYAMSAGTMMALGADHLVMGRQSQLGPIDAQLTTSAGQVSAAAVVEQFERAKKEISGKDGDLKNAHVWAPILQSMGPSRRHEAQNALDYGQSMVAEWLARRMCRSMARPKASATRIAKHFNAANLHKNHGRRIDREEVRSKGISVETLEDDAELQDAVLSLSHGITIAFEVSPATKVIASTTLGENWWIKNYQISPQPQRPAPFQTGPQRPT